MSLLNLKSLISGKSNIDKESIFSQVSVDSIENITADTTRPVIHSATTAHSIAVVLS